MLRIGYTLSVCNDCTPDSDRCLLSHVSVLLWCVGLFMHHVDKWRWPACSTDLCSPTLWGYLWRISARIPPLNVLRVVLLKNLVLHWEKVKTNTFLLELIDWKLYLNLSTKLLVLLMTDAIWEEFHSSSSTLTCAHGTQVRPFPLPWIGKTWVNYLLLSWVIFKRMMLINWQMIYSTWNVGLLINYTIFTGDPRNQI